MTYCKLIRLDDVEDQLATLNIPTIGLSKVKGRRREYFIECITRDDFLKACAWCEDVRALFDGFNLFPFTRVKINIKDLGEY